MSEYQYYTFRAVDHPLDDAAMAALRKLSTRAEITRTSLTNFYTFSDFKGDPDRLMDQYFDAHLYHANWGTRRLMIRVPSAIVPLADVQTFTFPDVVNSRLSANQDQLVIDFNTNDEESDQEYLSDESELLNGILPIRSELMSGDYRCLYLGWLVAAETNFHPDEVEDDDVAIIEPPVPPGLKKLSAALQDFAEFIRLDPNLIEAAAQASPDTMPTQAATKDVTAWIATLPGAEKNRMLAQIMQGDVTSVRSELARLHRESQRGNQVQVTRDRAFAPRRTIEQILAIRDKLEIENKRKAAEKSAKVKALQIAEAAVARAKRLDSLTGQEERLWREVELAIATKSTKNYDQAIESLLDLCGLAERTRTQSVIAGQIRRLREQHRTKTGLIKRLNAAKLPT